MSVEEINDLFDGIKNMDEVLDTNIHKLQKQIEEVRGAINLSRKRS